MITFKIGTSEYGNRVIAGTYQVNNDAPYESYTDANEVEHRIALRDSKVSGSFDMRFRTMTEYQTFLSILSTYKKSSDGTYPIKVTVNNKLTEHEGDFFIEFQPKRNRTAALQDYLETFTVYIEEA